MKRTPQKPRTAKRSRDYVRKHRAFTGNGFARALGLSDAEYAAVEEAARDAHMEMRDYCRLMVLCAAGMGGIAEHVERAINASIEVDQRPSATLRVLGKDDAW